MSKPTILRLAAPSRLVSARVFESLFDAHHGTWFHTERQDHDAFFNRVLGPPGKDDTRAEKDTDVLKRFREATGPFDFICPGFQSTRLIPRLLDLRNRSGARARLLFINHSPGAFPYVFSLLPGLIRQGDIITAPSACGTRVITALAPALLPFVHKIHHPMALPEPMRLDRRQDTILTLGRLVPEKLIHVQIEALARLRAITGRDVHMVVAGETRNLDTGKPSAYARSLGAACRRLNLQGKVSFPGVVSGREKQKLLGSASLMLYLSATLEETFPKAAVEGLGAGLPVVAAHWDGFAEVVGECGRLVRFGLTPSRSLELSPEAVATAMARCLAHPPSAEACRRQAARFNPENARAGYEKAVTRAMAHNPADAPAQESFRGQGTVMEDITGEGLLAGLPFLSRLSFAQAFKEYLAYTGHIRRSWESGKPIPASDAGYNTDLATSMALERKLAYFYADMPGSAARPHTSPVGMLAPEPMENRLAQAVGESPDRDTASACLLRLMEMDRPDLLEDALNTMAPDRFHRVRAYAETWLLCQQKKPDQALDRFLSAFDPEAFQSHEWPLLRLLGRICRQGGHNHPGIASILRQWLDRWPDSPGSGLVWLDHAAILGAETGWENPRASESLDRAQVLLGETASIRRMKAGATAAALAQEEAP